MMLERVLVSHPGRQHSHQLAMALADAGMLARYVTGVPTHPHVGGWLGGRLLRKTARAYAIPLDERLVHHMIGSLLLQRVAEKMLSVEAARRLTYRGYHGFDWYASRLLKRTSPDAVVAYENSALWTFRAARERGIMTVLDAASVHHRWQDRFLPPSEGSREHGRVVRRKDAEIELADHVLCTSEFARASYIEAGVNAERLHVAPLGVDVSRFQVRKPRTGAEDAASDVRFVFVGSGARLKGLDVLREATESLRGAGRRLRMTLVGAAGAGSGAAGDDGFVRIGWMSHERLAAELPTHDVLVLPSRFDSFGMVVAEAMACGLPVIVTEHVGAKEMVTPGENGLVIPAGHAAALATAMAWMIDQRDRLPALGAAARAAAERYDWSAYRRRVVALFHEMGAPR